MTSKCLQSFILYTLGYEGKNSGINIMCKGAKLMGVVFLPCPEIICISKLFLCENYPKIPRPAHICTHIF